MVVSPENSHRIANLSFVCACCVVLVHVPWTFGGVVGRDLLATTAVQFFYVVAGYFLALHFGESGWWRRAVVRRIWTLLVPYVLWMLITVSLLWLITGERPVGLGNSGLDLRQVPLLVPLWFIRGLFLLVLASPLIRWSLRQLGWMVLLVEFLVTVFVAEMLIRGGWTNAGGWGGLLTYGFPVEGMLYFSVGMWFRDHPISFSARRRWLWLAVAISVIVLRLALGVYGIAVAADLNVLIIPFCLIAMWLAMPTDAWPSSLVSCAFPIYIMHAVVLGVIWAIAGSRESCPFVIAVGSGILIPIAVGYGLKRMLPSVARMLFGGR